MSCLKENYTAISSEVVSTKMANAGHTLVMGMQFQMEVFQLQRRVR